MTVTASEAPVSTTMRISTRQVHDVALRTLRARGVHHAAAAAAAATVERLEIVTGTGLADLRALLARAGPVPAGPITLDAGGGVRPPSGASGLLLAAPLGDLLALGRYPSRIAPVHEPCALWPALVDHARRTGTPLALRWAAAGTGGGCATTMSGGIGFDGAAPGPGAWTCRLGPAPRRDPSVTAPAPAEAVARARSRRDGLAVDARVWAELTGLARGFLVDDGR